MSRRTIKSTIVWLRGQEPEKSANGIVYRGFNPTGRYVIDFALDFKGWTQYDTDQDAAYFGVWIHRTDLLVLTYAEGDWTLKVCETQLQFHKEIKSMNEFYGEGTECTVIDNAAQTITTFRQDRVELTDEFWDCECEKDYIRSKTEVNCSKCGAFRDEQPDSRQEEVSKLSGKSD